MPVLTDPVEPDLARALRRVVLAHRQDRARDTLSLGVGDPVLSHRTHALGPREQYDAALRTEVVAALLLRVPVTPRSLVWLRRPGPLDWQDADAAWLSATLTAGGEAGRPVGFLVVTRAGWVDPRSGAGVVWKRLRDRSRGTAATPDDRP